MNKELPVLPNSLTDALEASHLRRGEQKPLYLYIFKSNGLPFPQAQQMITLRISVNLGN
jgi:hypothetical protein